MADLTSPTIKPPSQTDLQAASGAQDVSGDPSMVSTGLQAEGAAPATQGDPSLPTWMQTAALPTDPSQPSSTGLEGSLGDFATGVLGSPSRYDSGLVQQGLDVINRDVADSTRQNRNALDEFHSQRGIVGSSVEAANMRQMMMDQEREGLRRKFQLGQDMAQTFAQDRLATANIGTQIGDFLRGGQQFDFARQQWAQQLGLNQQQLQEQIDSRKAEYADRQADRLHQMGLQDDSQEWQAAQAGLERAHEMMVQQLQSSDRRYALDQESAWREADRMLEEQLQNRRLALEEQGLSSDMAYRWASLELDNEMQRRQLEQQNQLQRLGYQTNIFDSLARYAAASGEPGLMSAPPQWLMDAILYGQGAGGYGGGYTGGGGGGGGYTLGGTGVPTTNDGGGVVDPNIGSYAGGDGPTIAYPPVSGGGSTIPSWMQAYL